jgi:hypothetical protein
MKKLVLSLLLIFPLKGCLPNCGQGDVRPYYDLQGINLFASRLVRVDQAPGSTNLVVSTLPTGRLIAPDSLVLEITATVTYHAALRKNPWASPWQAYACSPMPNGLEGSKESVKELVVRSEQDFDLTHPAGSSLNEYFQYVAVNEYRTQYQPLDNLVDYDRKLPAMPPRNFALRLVKSPTQTTSPYTFTLHYELTNGEMYMARIDNITFR